MLIKNKKTPMTAILRAKGSTCVCAQVCASMHMYVRAQSSMQSWWVGGAEAGLSPGCSNWTS